jgi:CTD small phosphatase-like protein 2
MSIPSYVGSNCSCKFTVSPKSSPRFFWFQLHMSVPKMDCYDWQSMSSPFENLDYQLVFCVWFSGFVMLCCWVLVLVLSVTSDVKSLLNKKFICLHCLSEEIPWLTCLYSYWFQLEVVKEICSTVSFQLHESVASEVALIVNMHTRKKSAARSAAGDHANTKTSRPSRRSTQPSVAEKKVTDLITSSSKKQKPGKVPSFMWNCWYLNAVIWFFLLYSACGADLLFCIL